MRFFLSFNVRQVNCQKELCRAVAAVAFYLWQVFKVSHTNAKLILAGPKLKARPPASLVGNYGPNGLSK